MTHQTAADPQSADPGVTGPLPPTAAQRRIWALCQIGQDAVAGVPALLLPLESADTAPSHLADLCARHPVLATQVQVSAGGKLDLFPGRQIPSVTSLSLSAADDREAAIATQVARPFRLPDQPPVRAVVMTHPYHPPALLLVVHPLLADQHSLTVLAGDPAVPVAPTAPLPYAEALDYWRPRLNPQEPPGLRLPVRPVPVSPPQGTRSHHARCLPAPMAGRLHRRGRETGLGVDGLLAAAMALLIARYGAGWQVSVGIIGSLRGPADLALCHAETITPLCLSLTPKQTVAEILSGVTTARQQALAHAAPFDRLAQDLWQENGEDGSALLHTLVDYLPLPTAPQTRRVSLPRSDASLLLTGTDLPDGSLTLTLNAAEDDHDPRLLERAIDHLLLLLEALTGPEDTQPGLLPLLTVADLERLGAPYDGTAPQDDTPVHQRIFAHAKAHPGQTAVLFDDRTVSRGELDTLAARIAARLRRQGVGPEHCVAILLRRSPEAIAAILGILRAGGAYIPLDPDHPDSRNHHILRDASVAAVVTEERWRSRLPVGLDLPLACLDDIDSETETPDPVPVDPAALAYVMYTSGSTGAPKGVAVEHGVLARHLDSTARIYDMDGTSRELPVLPFSSDGGHERWMVPLMLGGSIVLPHRPLLAPEEALDLMRRHGVTNASLPTSYVHQLAEWADLTGEAPDVRLYSFGGEAMAPATFQLITRALKAKTLINGYGPTETVMTPMVWKVPAGTAFEGLCTPIGRPVGLRRAYILDPQGLPVPVGVPGELYIGGDGVARGYVGLPEQTAARFLPDLLRPETERMYRTGDLARWREDGAIDFLGRADQQIKLRGYRIELGEIDSALKALPEVGEAVTVLREDLGDPMLVAYVVPTAGHNVDADAVRLAVTRTLPDYMVPAAVVSLPALPLTANSKLDRKALPAPQRTERILTPAETPLQQTLCDSLAEVLGLESVGIDEHFFRLGGSSILALKVLAQVRRRLPNCTMAIVDLFNHPTVRGLSALLASDTSDRHQDVIILRSGGTRPMLYCFPGLLVSTREYQKLIDYLGPDQPATGFICYTLAEDKQQNVSVADITARYADYIRRHSKGQPVTFLGWSWGGLLAYEAACQLKNDVDVRMIGMIDVCDMDTDFAIGAVPTFAPGQRDAVEARVRDWLTRTAMRAEWEQLFAVMDPLTWDQFLSFVLNSPYDLPLDGPAVGSTEHMFWVLIDNALIFRSHRLTPHEVPIRSFAAGDTLHRGLNLIDWRRYSSLTPPAEILHGTTHLHIVGMTAFHSRFARCLDAVAAELAARSR